MAWRVESLIFLALIWSVNGRSAPLLESLSQEMIDYINNYANTTWKVKLFYNSEVKYLHGRFSEVNFMFFSFLTICFV